MQQDYFPAAEKILSDLETILKKDPKLYQFEVIPVIKNENTSPVIHVGHSVGLEKWCVPYLYCHAYNHLLTLKRNGTVNREETGKLCRLLMGALLINPDVTLFWSMRKELISKGKIEESFELHFTSVVLSWKPNCLSVFNHRKWILSRMLREEYCSSLMRRELQVCKHAADRYANNYHAWSHRLWVLIESPPSLVNNEWLTTLDSSASHVSDHSCFHYRRTVITLLSKLPISVPVKQKVMSLVSEVQILPEMSCGEALYVAELCLISDLIRIFPGHETLWVHRRFVLNHLIHNRSFYLELQIIEQSFIQNCFHCMDSLQEAFAQKHIDWLRKVLDIHVTVI